MLIDIFIVFFSAIIIYSTSVSWMPFMNEHGVSQNDIYRLNVEVPIHESVSFMYSFKRLHNEDMILSASHWLNSRKLNWNVGQILK